MALPNENLLTFNQYKDAKTLFEAIQTRFGGNDTTKKTQKTLLKQLYENFNAPSTESLDFIFNRLKKIVSQLAILGENISLEDLNLKFLRSLPSEWNTHVVVWRNKPDLDTMSFDDLYNNFKIIEQEVKRTVTTSSSSGSQNMAFVSSPGTTNEVDTANVQVSTASIPVSTVSSQDSTVNLSVATVYAFLANQPNRSQLVHGDLEQIHEDDLEKMDLKWQLALLSMRARRYFQRTGKKITISGSDTAGYDKSKPEFEGIGFKANKSVYENSSNEIKKTTDALTIGFKANKSVCEKSEVMMVQKPVVNNVKNGTSQREVRPVWNNAMRINHQNFSNSRRNFTPIEVLTKSGIVPISAARQSSSKAATLVSAARPINTIAPKPYVDGRLRIFDSGCSRHMTENKSYLIINNMMEDLLHLQAVLKEMCDRKNSVLFIESECLILSPEFKLPDESQVMLKIPRKDNMYNFDLKNVVPAKGLTCLFAKATNDESKMWHGMLGHINFKTINKLVKGNLVRGLPSKIFENDHTCVACQKGKQHKATLVTDDYSRFSWVIFLAKKDETCRILKDFISGIENQLDHKVKIIRCDNGTEFKNYDMNQFYGMKGIKREFSNARTLQQNEVAERKNRTLIEAARTMLADSLLPIPFWAEAVNTACYAQNKVDEGFLVGYSINSKAFRVFNSRTRKVEENLHVNFLEIKPNVAGIGPTWLFDIDSLTNSMNYQPVSAGNRTNGYAGSETNSDAGQAGKEKVPDQEYILLPLLHTSSYVPSSSKEAKPNDDAGKKAIEQPECVKGDKTDDLGSINTASLTVNTASVKNGNLQSTFDELVISTPITLNAASSSLGYLHDLEDTGIFDDAYDDRDEGVEADYNNLETEISVSPIPSTRANKDHPKDQIIGELHSTV
ncbi:putative ribonuclease H-like domain-containing protein [Tanacetum coccineum]